VAELRQSEQARAQDVWRRKFDAPPQNPQETVKQMRFLISRGFAPDVVRRVVAAAGQTDD